jgi:hypothetical protein
MSAVGLDTLFVPLLQQMMQQQIGTSLHPGIAQYMSGSYAGGYYGSGYDSPAMQGLAGGYSPLVLAMGHMAGVIKPGEVLLPVNRPFQETIESYLNRQAMFRGYTSMRNKQTYQNVTGLMERLARERGTVLAPEARSRMYDMIHSPMGQLGLGLVSSMLPELFEQSFGRSGSGLAMYQTGWNISSRFYDGASGRLYDPQQREAYAKAMMNYYYGTPEQRQQARFSSNEMSVFYGYLSSQGLLEGSQAPRVQAARYVDSIRNINPNQEQKQQQLNDLFNYTRWTEKGMDNFVSTNKLRETVRLIDEVNAARDEYNNLRSDYQTVHAESPNRAERFAEVQRAYTRMRHAEIAVQNASEEEKLVLDAEKLQGAESGRMRRNLDFISPNVPWFDIQESLSTESRLSRELAASMGIQDLSKWLLDEFDINVPSPGEGMNLYRVSEELKKAEHIRPQEESTSKLRHVYDSLRETAKTRLEKQGYGWLHDEVFDSRGHMKEALQSDTAGLIKEIADAQQELVSIKRRQSSLAIGTVSLEGLDTFLSRPELSLSLSEALSGIAEEYNRNPEAVDKDVVKKILSDKVKLDADPAKNEQLLNKVFHNNMLDQVIAQAGGPVNTAGFLKPIASALIEEETTLNTVNKVLDTISGWDLAKQVELVSAHAQEEILQKNLLDAGTRLADKGGLFSKVAAKDLDSINLSVIPEVQEALIEMMKDPNVEKFLSGISQLSVADQKWQAYAKALGSLKAVMTDRHASPSAILSTLLSFAGGNLHQTDVQQLMNDMQTIYSSARMLGYNDQSIRERLGDSTALAAATSANRNFVAWHTRANMMFESAVRQNPAMTAVWGSLPAEELTAIAANDTMGYISGLRGNLHGSAIRMRTRLEQSGIQSGAVHDYLEALHSGREQFTTTVNGERRTFSTALDTAELQVLWESSIQTGGGDPQEFMSADMYRAMRSENQEALYANRDRIPLALMGSTRGRIIDRFATLMTSDSSYKLSQALPANEYEEAQAALRNILTRTGQDMFDADEIEKLWGSDESLRGNREKTLKALYARNVETSGYSEPIAKALLENSNVSMERMYLEFASANAYTTGLDIAGAIQRYGTQNERQIEVQQRIAADDARKRRLFEDYNISNDLISRVRDILGHSDMLDIEVFKQALGILPFGEDMKDSPQMKALRAVEEASTDIMKTEEQLSRAKQDLAQGERENRSDEEMVTLRDTVKVLEGHRQTGLQEYDRVLKESQAIIAPFAGMMSKPDAMRNLQLFGSLEARQKVDWDTFTVWDVDEKGRKMNEDPSALMTADIIEDTIQPENTRQKRFVRKDVLGGTIEYAELGRDGKLTWKALDKERQKIVEDTVQVMHKLDPQHGIVSFGNKIFAAAHEGLQDVNLSLADYTRIRDKYAGYGGQWFQQALAAEDDDDTEALKPLRKAISSGLNDLQPFIHPDSVKTTSPPSGHDGLSMEAATSSGRLGDFDVQLKNAGEQLMALGDWASKIAGTGTDWFDKMIGALNTSLSSMSPNQIDLNSQKVNIAHLTIERAIFGNGELRLEAPQLLGTIQDTPSVGHA